MAKAKKSESTTGKAPARKTTKKASVAASAPSTSTPLIDTSLAAANAARVLASRAKLHVQPPKANSGNKESSTFKQLKESLNRSAAHLVDNAMGGPSQPIKTNSPLHGGNQSVHSQTQSGGASRVNVPRRTAG